VARWGWTCQPEKVGAVIRKGEFKVPPSGPGTYSRNLAPLAIDLPGRRVTRQAL